MKKTLLLFLFLAFNSISAQTPNWTWAKNISLYFNGKQDMTAVDNQGNVYLIGDFKSATATIAGTTFTNTSNVDYSDAYILKFNSTGTLLWSKQLTGSKNESITSIDADSTGNIVITGTFGESITMGSTVLTGPLNVGTLFFAKLDSNGDFIWAKSNNNTNEYYSISDIKSDLAGNTFATGNVYSATLTFGSVVMSVDSNSPTVNNYRAYITKFDSNGNCIWGKMGTSIEPNPFGSISMSVAPDNNGGAAICGRFSHNNLSFDSITLTKTTQNNNSSNMFVAKFDSNGNAMWAYNTGSIYENNTIASIVTIDLAGNVLVGGSYPNTVHFGNITLSSSGGSQLFLTKYSPDGTVQWAKSTGFMSNSYTTTRSIDTDENGNIYIAGLAYASAIDFTNNVTLSNLGTVGAFFVTKYNSSGVPVWAKGVPNIDANNDLSIDCKAENDLFIGGTFDKSTLQLGSTVLTKSSTSYDLFIGRLYSPPLGIPEFDNNSISIFPNPAHDVVNISNIKTPYTYNLYNVMGVIIKKGTLLNELETINVNALQTGLYILKLTDNNSKSIVKKIVVE